VSIWVAVVCGHDVAIEVALYLWPRWVVTVCKMPCHDLLAVRYVHLSSGRKTRLARWSATITDAERLFPNDAAAKPCAASQP